MIVGDILVFCRNMHQNISAGVDQSVAHAQTWYKVHSFLKVSKIVFPHISYMSKCAGTASGKYLNVENNKLPELTWT
jgi:hypothetical protein